MCLCFAIMGKSKNKRSIGGKTSRNVPLAEQLLEEKCVRPPGREKHRRRREADDEVSDPHAPIE